MKLIIDSETNGLLQECTKIHCLGVVNLDSEDDTDLIIGQSQVDFYLDWICKNKPEIIGHNIFGYDNEVFKKLLEIDLTKTNKIHDTFIMSQVLFGDLKDQDYKVFKPPKKYIGSHSLAAWGYRLGVYKGEYLGGFEEYNDDMGSYCVQDCIVTKTLYNYFMSVIGGRTWK